MIITWYGEAGFLLESSGVRVLIEPPQKESGLVPPRLKSDILIYSKKVSPLAPVGSEETFVVDGPGEYEIKGINISGVGDDDGNIIYTILMDGVKISHFGFIKKEPNNEKLEFINSPDIVLMPVGGLPALPGRQAGGRQGLKDELFDAEMAMKLINKMEPKIAIPMLYDIKGLKIKRAPLSLFLKESEAKNSPQSKLSVKKKDLAEEETKIVILEKV